jgi:predicted 2-oxoglutarate/Fe(II)-dependent dioxygenase YbiX
MLRVLDVVPFAGDRGDIDAVLGALDRLAPTTFFTGVKLQAPILFLPNVFEPTFCQSLIDLYERMGGQESGFMSEVDGRTVLVHNHHHKRRKDCTIEDDDIIRETQSRVLRRIVPMIQRAYQFKATRMERYIICCYEDKDGAHFRPHRDNTTKGTAHRRFAVSINLNADFEGGEICFPEFGQQTYKPPVGGAVVFSCSLLHAVTTVTRGRRYAFLPFLYDEEAARLREANAAFLESDGPAYKSGIGGT